MDLTEKTLEQNVLLNGRILKMHVDKVELPNGELAER